jgi:hypothetical protein
MPWPLLDSKNLSWALLSSKYKTNSIHYTLLEKHKLLWALLSSKNQNCHGYQQQQQQQQEDWFCLA